METSTATQKPAMKWVGNKQGTPVIDRVAELYQPFRSSHVWIEPFVGIGGALLTINPDRAFCCDASIEIIGLHRWIKNGGKVMDFDREWTEADFKMRRDRFNALQIQYSSEASRVDRDEFFSLMLWLNRAGFNGLWRVNKKGLFNVPVGRSRRKEPNRFEAATLPNYKASWQFQASSFGDDQIILEQTPRFIYADPPYWGTHSAYTKSGFNWDDQVRLAEKLAASSNPSIASNSSSAEIVALYSDLGFTIELIPVRRSISCKGSDRVDAVEMLAIKNCGG